MPQIDRSHRRRIESRALAIGMAGNLLMAVAGLVAGIAANSSAILLDGLFSLVGFCAAFLGRRIGTRSEAPPDRHRPFGYAADEAIFSTFRALSLLGLILFAVANAVRNIVAHALGAPAEPLIFAPMIAYFALIGTVCLLLWLTHFMAWRRSGRTSSILRLEMKAALFDGIITAAAGSGLFAIYLLSDGILAPLAPVGDSVIVLLLCLTATGVYLREFRAGLGEIAGVSAGPKLIATARRALRPAIRADGGTLKDLSVVKLGRLLLITVYYDPGRPVDAADMDVLNLRMIRDARARMDGADVLLLVTGQPRRWPPDLNPYE